MKCKVYNIFPAVVGTLIEIIYIPRMDSGVRIICGEPPSLRRLDSRQILMKYSSTIIQNEQKKPVGSAVGPAATIAISFRPNISFYG